MCAHPVFVPSGRARPGRDEEELKIGTTAQHSLRLLSVEILGHGEQREQPPAHREHHILSMIPASASCRRVHRPRMIRREYVLTANRPFFSSTASS